MPRAATTTDAFNAIAETGRRDILSTLARGEQSVTDLVQRLAVPQPHVSKHLAVLRAVDLVRFRTVGRQRVYRVNANALRPVHSWLTEFERLWNDRLDRLDDLLAERADDTHP
jgi:DNA-binding transcriptional ArsR family regulator